MTNQGSEPLRCVAFGTNVWTTEACDMREGPCACGSWHAEDNPPAVCGGPVIETRPTCEVCEREGNDSHCRWHPLAKRLVHVEQDGPCQKEVLHTQWSGGYAPCGELEDCPQHQSPLGHAHVPRIIPDSELHAVEVER